MGGGKTETTGGIGGPEGGGTTSVTTTPDRMTDPEGTTIKIAGSDENAPLGAEIAAPISTETTVGGGISAVTPSFLEDEEKRKSVSKKRLGTRGLQIPLTTTVSTTTTASEAGGIQI